MSQKTNLLVSIILILVLYGISLSSLVFASNQDAVNITVAIGICGNEIIEAYEECDGETMQGNTCISNGYDGGKLYCDIGCDLDFTDCITNEPIDPGNGEGEEKPEEQVNEEEDIYIESPLRHLIQGTRLPENLRFYDFDKSGRISISEMTKVLNSWVNGWRLQEVETCDISEDNRCDLIDMSIILYWINR